jgi:acyl transferase domain-containing protein
MNVGEDPKFRTIGRDSLSSDSAMLPCLASDGRESRTLLETVGALYMRRAAIDWSGFATDPDLRKVNLPRYPFQRRRYWIRPRPQLERPMAARPVAGQHPLLGLRLQSPALKDIVFETQISSSSPSLLSDHAVYGQLVLPASAYLEMALAGAKARMPGQAFFSLRQCNLSEALVLPENDGVIRLQTRRVLPHLEFGSGRLPSGFVAGVGIDFPERG